MDWLQSISLILEKLRKEHFQFDLVFSSLDQLRHKFEEIQAIQSIAPETRDRFDPVLQRIHSQLLQFDQFVTSELDSIQETLSPQQKKSFSKWKVKWKPN